MRRREPSGRWEKARDFARRRTCDRRCGAAIRLPLPETDDEDDCPADWVIVRAGLSISREELAILLRGRSGIQRLIRLTASAAAALPG